MKLPQNQYSVQSNFDGTDIDFTIGNNATLFEILRKGIYKDPIGSVVREIAANAKDAMSRVNKENEPISITLNDSYMVVTDEGCGMSPEKIKEVYSVYGNSDKRDTNSEQGAMGLGAKAGFAVSDSYTVETSWDGIRYTYLCYVNESGAGAIKLLSEEPSEIMGTTIKVPIGSSRHTFKEAVYKYTTFYNPQPKVFGEFMPPHPKLIMETPSWRIYDNLRNVGNPNVILDSIPYQYDLGYSYRLPDNVVMVCNVGDLEITASRESLRECEHNRNFLCKIVEAYREDIYKITYDKIKEEKDYNKTINMLISAQRELKKVKVYEWNGVEFTYPLKEKIRRFDRNGYRKYVGYEVNCLNNSTNTHFLKGGEKPLTNKQKRQLGIYWSQNQCDVYMVPDDFIFPSIDINNIVITYPKRVSKNIPRYVRGKRYSKRSYSNIEFNENILYTTEEINKLESAYLLGEVVQVEDKSLPRIKKYTKWKSLEEYLEGFGDDEPLAKKGAIILNEDQIKKWKFLKSYVSPEIKEVLSHETSDNLPLLNVCKYLCINKKLEYAGMLANMLHKRYPLLQSISDYSVWHDPATQKNVIDYVNLIEKEKE